MLASTSFSSIYHLHEHYIPIFYFFLWLKRRGKKRRIRRKKKREKKRTTMDEEVVDLDLWKRAKYEPSHNTTTTTVRNLSGRENIFD